MTTQLDAKILFIVALACAASGLFSAPVALGVGIAYAFTFTHPYGVISRRFAKVLLQASVVALGFGMNLKDVQRAGHSGFLYTAVGITATLILGILLGRLLRVPAAISFLISCGTAICGGSAIAAISPILQADDEEISVALGTIFILNSVGLVLFPRIGWALHLSQEQFGLWAALAIHDTSSVVAASTRYGAVALTIGTTVKLVRALWIVPLSIVTATVKRVKGRIQWPWFILFFAVAVGANTYLPSNRHNITASLAALGKPGMTVTLFLIGTNMSPGGVREIGVRPFAQGILLWVVVAVISLGLIKNTIISF